mgnify:CR=1 FL=1
MSGHSKWHNIQKTKGAADAKRSAAFTKIAKEIIVAVKEGGGSGDPANNSRLATVIAKAKAAKVETTYTTASVEKRSITNSLTGSGTLQPADSYTVTTLVSGEVLSDTFEEGDMVEKDQLLYTIDSSDVSSTESQAQTSYSQALKAKYPTADISGTVSEVYVSNGDAVNAGTELVKISASNDLTIDFQFSYANDGDFYVGQPAKIYINGYAGYIDGTVAQIGGSSMANATGMKMTTVRVKAVNPGLVTGDCTASAVVGNYTSYGQTTVKVGTGSTITASASGKVSGLTLMPGDSVSSGQRKALTALGESEVMRTVLPRFTAILGMASTPSAEDSTISASTFMPGRRPSVSSIRTVTG